MSTISWTNAAGGSWSVGSNWSGGVVPTAADDVVIALPGTYAITTGFGSNPAHSVTLNDAGASLSIGFGTLALGGVLEIDAGAVSTNGGPSSVIAGGTIYVQGGTFAPSGATLSGVTVEGYMPLGQPSTGVTFTGGLTLEGVGGVGAGTIDVQSDQLNFSSSQIISGGTIILDNTSTGLSGLNVFSPGTLTLAPSVTVISKPAGFYVGSIVGSVINQGVISGALSLGYVGSASALLNQGTVAIGAGQVFSVQSTNTLNNTGLISIASGGTLSLLGAFSNTGSISAAGGTILAGGAVTQAELLALQPSGGDVILAGTLNNAGGTLQVGPATVLGTLLVTGGIKGGVIQDSGGGIVLNAGTLDGVTYQGTLDVTTSATATYGNYLNEVVNGLTLTGTGGVGPGLAVVTGDLVLGNTETINAGTIDLGSASGTASFAAASGVTGTLGSGVDVEQTGSAVAIGGYGVASFGVSYVSPLSGTLLSQGTIDAGFASGTMTLVSGSTLVNQGLMEVRNGETLLAQGSVVNAGTLVIGAGSTLVASAFSNSGTIIGSGATVKLNGSMTPAELQAFAGSGAAITLAGTLNNAGGTLQVGPATALGDVTLGPGGAIVGGVVQDSGGGLIEAGGTLSGVTYQGPLNLTQPNAGLVIQNGITLMGAGGVGPGTINLTGNSSGLTFAGDSTLNATTINIGSSAGDSLSGYSLSVLSPGSLTIGASSTVVHTGQSASLYEINNAGTIQAAFAGGSFYSNYGLTNTGTIAVSNRDAMTIFSLTNGGQVSVASGAVLNLNSLTPLAGGHVTETGATLNLGGALTLPALATISRSGGIVALSLGTLDLGGGTLNVGAGSPLGQLRMRVGTVSNGTIHDGGGGMVFYGGFGQLQNVTYQGLVNLTPAMSNLVVQGLTATNAAGTGPGAVNLLGASSTLTFQGTQTFNNATINLGSDNVTTTLHVNDMTGTGAVLTLGAGANLQQRGAMAQINIDRGLGDALINQGLIAANDAGGRLIVAGGTFTNAGKIVVANGGTFALEADQVGNLPGNVLNGGYWEVDGNSTLSLGFDDPILTMNATMVLNGPGSQIVYDDTTTFKTTSIEQSVHYIGAAGVLVVQNGQAFNDPGLFYDQGKVILSNGSLSGNPIAIGSTGLIYGTGTITANNIYDSGHVMAQGGTLVVNAPLKPGAPVGNALVNTGATLIAEQAVAVPVQFLATTGTLALAQANQMTGTIVGFTGSDAIDLLNVNPAAVTLSYAGNAGGGVLTVKSGAATAASLRFNGSYVLANFHAAADGHGGTLILDPPVGSSSADWRMTQADLQQPPRAPIGASVMNAGTVTTGFGAPPPEGPPPALLAHH